MRKVNGSSTGGRGFRVRTALMMYFMITAFQTGALDECALAARNGTVNIEKVGQTAHCQATILALPSIARLVNILTGTCRRS